MPHTAHAPVFSSHEGCHTTSSSRPMLVLREPSQPMSLAGVHVQHTAALHNKSTLAHSGSHLAQTSHSLHVRPGVLDAITRACSHLCRSHRSAHFLAMHSCNMPVDADTSSMEPLPCCKLLVIQGSLTGPEQVPQAAPKPRSTTMQSRRRGMQGHCCAYTILPCSLVTGHSAAAP